MKRRVLFISALLAIGSFSKADPPPFGTVVQRWSLRMSGSYAGAGITWVRDSGKLFLMDQGYAGPNRVWKLDVADPPGTIVQVPWTFVNLGLETTDIPWGIAWDADSGCFWISQILDGDIYGGCYLLRHVWNDSAWVWGGASGDSWFVGDGSNGGGLQCLWTAGMEKNEYTGIYYFTPVHTSPSQMNHIGKFDPYTKTDLGRLPYGDEVSERAVTLIPWDSAYILTSSWSSGLVKRDTLGRIVQRADSGGDGPADMAVEVPSHPEPDSTVWVYDMSASAGNYLAKISTGLTWRQLPSALLHSVRPVEIVSPSGAVDSGETVTPKLVVQNMSSDTAEDVDVHFTIDDPFERLVYHDSTTVALPPMTTDTLEFEDWVPVGRGNMTAVAWTHWSEDSVPEDDTLEQDFLVRVLDVAIVEVPGLPHDTIDPGTVYPQCVLANHGNVASGRFLLTVNIGQYWDTLVLDNLMPGMNYPVTFLNPWTATAGIWYCTFNAQVPGDLRPGDNDTTFWFVVRGGISDDVACEAILVPSGIVDTLPFLPEARYANYGTSDVTCTTFCWIEDTTTDAIVYSDESPVFLPESGNATVAYKPCTLRVEAPYMVSCSIHLAGDQNWLNNAIHQPFRVGAGPEYDVLVSAILAPFSLVDSGAAVLPRAEVFNAGLYTETFPVWFRLPGGYEQVRQLTLDAGMYDTVAFPIWRANVHLGGHSATAWTLLEGDLNPDNDTLVKPFTVRKRDLGVSAIIWPKDTVPDSAEIHPCFEVTNYGTTVETFVPLFKIGQFQVGGETIFGMVGGTSQTIEFEESWLSSAGTWFSRAEVIPVPADPNPDNDVMIDTFWVLPGAGIKECPSLPVRIGLGQPEPSLFRSATRVRFGLPKQSDIALALYSADGVLVRTLQTGVLPAGYHRIFWNGEDDNGRFCAPGVYYLRMTSGDFLASRKLVKLK